MSLTGVLPTRPRSERELGSGHKRKRAVAAAKKEGYSGADHREATGSGIGIVSGQEGAGDVAPAWCNRADVRSVEEGARRSADGPGPAAQRTTTNLSTGFISAGRSPGCCLERCPGRNKLVCVKPLGHIAPVQEKSYWLIYSILASVTSIEGGSLDVGMWGINDK